MNEKVIMHGQKYFNISYEFKKCELNINHIELNTDLLKQIE